MASAPTRGPATKVFCNGDGSRALAFRDGRAASLLAGHWVPGIRFSLSEIDEMGTPIKQIAERLVRDAHAALSACEGSEDGRQPSTASGKSPVNRIKGRSATEEDYAKRAGWTVTMGRAHMTPREVQAAEAKEKDGSDDPA
jgi:hypothetical protein